MENIDVKKTKYFVIAIIILIILGMLLILHFNNKEMVNGDVDENKTTETTTTVTTTTKKIVTTKKVKVEETSNEVEEETKEVIYKSTIDENNKLVFNYKLTDEINEFDKIITSKMIINETFKSNNIIGLYDISFYDQDLNKKQVNNSLVNIKIPIKDELVGYDEYKIVYINDKNEITNEVFEVKVDKDYIEFNTTHLSLYGVVGTKKVVEEVKKDIDLSNVSVDIKLNDVLVEDKTNILVERKDKLDVVINNINYEYDVYYAFRDESNIVDYKLYDNNILENLVNGNKYALLIKVVVEDSYRVFEIGNINIYDIVFIYDKEIDIEQKDPIGTIYNEDNTIYKNEDGTDYAYTDTNINKDIVIDYKEEEPKDNVQDKNNDELSLNNQIEINDTNEENISSDMSNDQENNDIEGSEESVEEPVGVKLKVNGNIYLVEKTDISELEMTGYLYIDTSEDIIFSKDDNNKLSTSNLYMITIRSKEFTLNGSKYEYEVVGEDLVIKKVEKDETILNPTEIKTDVTDTFVNIFADPNYKVWHTEDGLVIANPTN